MRVLIIEDEIPAVDNLIRLLKEYNPKIEVVGKANSIQKAVEWLSEYAGRLDLIFMDIQLGDGLSFDIFKLIEIRSPVIFITAYHQYAIDAFKVNGIDYLLKPLNYEALFASMKKMERLKEQFAPQSQADQLLAITQTLSQLSSKNYKNRFMVKVGEHIRSVPVEDISLFYAEGRTAYLITNQAKKFIIDHKLESLEEMLDPAHFFRVNRSFILNIRAIREVLVYSGSRLKIILDQETKEEIIVSREKVNEFKSWFDGI